MASVLLKILYTCGLDFGVVCGLINLSSWLFLWFLICGLQPHGAVESDSVWCGLVQRFIWEFQMTSHIYAPNLRGKHRLAFK